MGNSASSKVTNINNTLLVNKNDINILNKNLTNQVANTVINNAKKCSANINQLQSIKFKDIVVAGDFNLNADQKQQTALTFSCVNTDQTHSDIANEMMQEMMNNLQNNNSSEILSKLEAQAAASQKNGFLSTAFGNSTKSKSNNTVNFNQTNTNNTNLQNIIENSIVNNFTTNNISDCISQVNNNQLIDTQQIVIGGNANFAIRQDQASALFSECIQTADIGQKITNSVMTSIGVQSENINDTVAKTEMKSEAIATQVNESVSLLASLAPFLISFGGPVIGIIICCVICCIICVAIFVLPALFSGKTDKGSDVSEFNQNNEQNETNDDYNEQRGGFLFNLFTDTFSESLNVINKQYYNYY
jgi:hypothetical protein